MKKNLYLLLFVCSLIASNNRVFAAAVAVDGSGVSEASQAAPNTLGVVAGTAGASGDGTFPSDLTTPAAAPIVEAMSSAASNQPRESWCKKIFCCAPRCLRATTKKICSKQGVLAIMVAIAAAVGAHQAGLLDEYEAKAGEAVALYCGSEAAVQKAFWCQYIREIQHEGTHQGQGVAVNTSSSAITCDSRPMGPLPRGYVSKSFQIGEATTKALKEFRKKEKRALTQDEQSLLGTFAARNHMT